MYLSSDLDTDLLGEFPIRYWLTAKLDVEGVSPGYTWSVHEADSSVTIIHDVNVDIRVTVAADAACNVTLACLSSVHLDHTFLIHGDG